MKYPKSSSHNLRELFDRGISVRYVTEPLASFDYDTPAETVREFMERREYDVIGVRHDGIVTGFARATDLADGCLGDHEVDCALAPIVDDASPLFEAISSTRQSTWLFVRVLGRVGGIVTRGDMQKAPVRLWLFGLISLIEMQLLRIIREEYLDGGWEKYLSKKRLEKAQDLFAERRHRNEAIDLADCLQFCDKRDIILESNSIRQSIGLNSRTKASKLLKDLEHLRDNLAHAQDIIAGTWPQTVDLAVQAEEFLRQCEEVSISHEAA